MNEKTIFGICYLFMFGTVPFEGVGAFTFEIAFVTRITAIVMC